MTELRYNHAVNRAMADAMTADPTVVLFGEEPEPEAFVEQLEREHAIKPDVRFAKPMGFVR